MTQAQRRLLDEARRSIEAAELLASRGFHGYAASRSYYAMFYIAEAFLLAKDLSFTRHSAVISAFGQHCAKTGVVPEESHKHLIEAMELRQAGDYEAGVGVSPRQCQEQIRRAQALLSLAEARLGHS